MVSQLGENPLPHAKHAEHAKQHNYTPIDPRSPLNAILPAVEKVMRDPSILGLARVIDQHIHEELQRKALSDAFIEKVQKGGGS